MAEPRTHYQISLTARQAVGLFVGLLLSLGLAFCLGLMAGLSGRPGTHARAALPPEQTGPAPASEPIPAVETAAPLPASSRASRESLPPGGSEAAVAEPTAPPTLQTFEDGTAEEAAAAQHAAPPSTAKPAAGASPPRPAPAVAGRIWVQVASLSARGEADALTLRLSRRGYHTQIVSDKGRLRVRVGPYRTTEDARRAAKKLRKQDRIQNPWVVSEAR